MILHSVNHPAIMTGDMFGPIKIIFRDNLQGMLRGDMIYPSKKNEHIGMMLTGIRYMSPQGRENTGAIYLRMADNLIRWYLLGLKWTTKAT